MEGTDELAVIDALEHDVRNQLYGIRSTGVRALAVSALAAGAAERAHRRSDAQPDLRNATSDLWHRHLVDVWRHLEGDGTAHRALSLALADFLSGPFNHTDGQDGPDDFDRPQTIAACSAVASVVLWGVDFATTALRQSFELIDLQYDATYPPERAEEVERERRWVQDACTAVVEAASRGREGFTPALLTYLR